MQPTVTYADFSTNRTIRITSWAAKSTRSCPGIGCGTGLGTVLYRGGGVRQGSQRRDDERDCTRGREPHRKDTRHGRTSGSGPGSGPTQIARSGARRRRLHDSIRTEQAYVDWIPRVILFHGKRRPRGDRSRGSGGVSDPISRSTARSPRPPRHQALNAIVPLPAGIEKGNSAGWSMGEVRGQSKNRDFCADPELPRTPVPHRDGRSAVNRRLRRKGSPSGSRGTNGWPRCTRWL